MLKLLRNLKIWQKLSLMVILLSLGILALDFIYIREKNDLIKTTKSELMGVEYLTALKQLFQHIPQHRGAASAALNGDSSFRERLPAIEELIDKDFTALETVDAKYGTELNTTDHLSDIKKKWQALKTITLQLQPQDSFDQHTKLIADIASLILDIGDSSTLILDPDLPTYHLIDSVINIAPNVAENLGQLRARGTAALVKKQITTENRIQIAAQLMNVQSSLQNLSRGLTVALKADAELEQQIAPQMTQITTQTNAFADLVKQRIVQPETIDWDSREYFNNATATIDLYFKIYDTFLQSLNNILQKRQSQFVYDRYLALGVMLFSLGLSLTLAIFITQTITKQIESITQLFSNIGMGDFEARVQVLSNDELGNMSLSLNAMLDNTLSLIQSQDERERIQNSIMKLLEDISGVADGDLTKEAEVSTEITGAIADSFNLMIEQLRNIISNVQDTTLQVSAAATEVQATAEHLTKGSESQSSQIVDTSAAVEEMAASIQQVSENAALSATVSEQARLNASQGNVVVNKTINGMRNIRQQVQETSKRIKRLGESSQEIGEIVLLISDIADRTSILALNASIEAAMAGEAGRGFAVVASEVERLADRSAQATKRIGTLIKSIQSETNEAVSAMESTTREVVLGSELANEAGKSLGEIEGVSNRLAELIQAISLASKQQARGSEAIAKSMGSISDITQQTAAGTKQATESIRNLANLAEDLRSSVTKFKLPNSDDDMAYSEEDEMAYSD